MKNKLILSAVIISLLFFSCTSTRITSSWTEPNKQVTLTNLNKVLVVALLKNETNRHKAEDEMVTYLKGKGIVSYNYLDDNFNKKNEEALRDKIREDGFDAAITLRLIDVEKEQTYTPGNIATYPTYYRTFGGYYRRSFSTYSTPGTYSTTKIYTVETNVFSIKEDKIIWTGITETTNPEGVDKMINEVVKTVYKKMKKDNFIINK